MSDTEYDEEVCPDCDLILLAGTYLEHRDSGVCGAVREAKGDLR